MAGNGRYYSLLVMQQRTRRKGLLKIVLAVSACVLVSCADDARAQTKIEFSFTHENRNVVYDKIKLDIQDTASAIHDYIDSKGRETILLVSRHGEVTAYDAQTLKANWTFTEPNVEWNAAVSISEAPLKFLVVGTGGHVAMFGEDGKHQLLTVDQNATDANFNAVYYLNSGDGQQRVIMGDLDGAIYSCSLDANKLGCNTMQGHDWPVKKVAHQEIEWVIRLDLT